MGLSCFTSWSSLTIGWKQWHTLCFKTTHDRVLCLGLSWEERLSKDGYERSTVLWYCWSVSEAVEREWRQVLGVIKLCGRGWAHPGLCRLNPSSAFDILVFKTLHMKSVIAMNQTTASWLQTHSAPLTPLTGMFLFFPLCLKKLFFSVFFFRFAKASWDAFPCYCKW